MGRRREGKVARGPKGKRVDALAWAKRVENKGESAFVVGGAYGVEEAVIQKCHYSLSLSNLTFSHKVAKVVVSEQIYRAFCLINNHPYHK